MVNIADHRVQPVREMFLGLQEKTLDYNLA